MLLLHTFLFLFMKVTELVAFNSDLKWDQYGYIMYCPCMGRLGNQVEQFLGALRFAKDLNRTMVVPPWVAYDYAAQTSFTPYDVWFDFKQLNKFHKVILMHDFMQKLAPDYWPDDGISRKIYCPETAAARSPDLKSCPAKLGSPFGPFWDNFGINFNGGSQLFPHGTLSSYKAETWNNHFPLKQNPVIVFMGAPGAFPIKKHNRILQKYVKFSDKIESEARNFIDKNINGPYIGVHLRNGIDWERACQHISGIDGHFMASAQCVGYDNSKMHKLTKEMCFPSKAEIVDKVQATAKLHNITHLFVATDHDAMTEELEAISLKIVKYNSNYPIMDLVLLSMADVFIGNCVSTFTSFVVRNREIAGKPNYFFAFDHPHSKIVHEDL